MATFFPFGPPPIANLERLVKMQRAALAQAEADLAEARGERAIAEIDEHEELQREQPRTLPPEGSADRAAKIIAAHRKALGLDPPEFDDRPRQIQQTRTTAEEILAAHDKATGRKR